VSISVGYRKTFLKRRGTSSIGCRGKGKNNMSYWSIRGRGEGKVNSVSLGVGSRTLI